MCIKCDNVKKSTRQTLVTLIEMSPSTPCKTKKCKHKLKKEIQRGTIRLELRWFKPKDCECCDDSFNDCPQCCAEERLCGYYKGIHLSQVSIPTPSSYEELQQRIAMLIPVSCGIATIERPDGTQVYPMQPFEDGEVIIFREIRSLRKHEDGELRAGKEECTWEKDVYQQLCQSYDR